MPAQIRPTRLEVSDRFPMLGFSIRVDGPTQRAEVALATEPELFGPEGKVRRTASNFYSTRGFAPLQVARGEGMFVVPPQVLMRFIGNEKLYFGLATGSEGNGGTMKAAVIPNEASPYVSLKGLTGRSMQRVRVLPTRQQRAAGYTNGGSAMFEWAGDAATPGMEPVRVSAATTPGAAGAAKRNGAAPAAPEHATYDDGFGPMPSTAAPSITPNATPDAGTPPAAPAIRVAAPPPAVLPPAPAPALDAPAVSLTGERVQVAPPPVRRLSETQSALIKVGLTALAGPLAPLLHLLPVAASAAGVSIGVGPAVGAGLGAGGTLGAGLIFASDGSLGAYGSAEIDIGFITSISTTVQITVVRGGIENFSGWNTAIAISGGEGVVGGGAALFDLNANFQGVSANVGIGVGFSPIDFYVAVQRGVAVQLGMAAALGRPSAAAPMAGAMIIGPDDVASAQRYAPQWADLFNWSAPAAVASGVAARGMSVQRIQDALGELNLDRYEVSVAAMPAGWTAASLFEHLRTHINDFLDTRNSEFIPYAAGTDDTLWTSASPVGTVFKIDIVGPDNAAVVASLVEPTRWRFTTISTPDTGDHPVSGHREFGYRTDGDATVFYTRGADRATSGIGETIAFAGADHLWRSFQTKFTTFVNDNGGSAIALPRFSERFHPQVVRILYGTAASLAAEADADAGEEARPLAEPPPPRARALDGGASAAIAIGGFLVETLRDSSGDVTWELDQFAQRKHPNDVAPANPAAYRDAQTIRLEGWPVAGGLIDDISAWFTVDWQYNGTSLGNVRISNIGTNDAVGWALHVRAQIMDDNIIYPPGQCAALRIRFHYRFSRSIGADVLAATDLHLYGDGTWEESSRWLQSSALGLGETRRPGNARAMDGVGAVVSATGIIVGAITSSEGDVSWQLDAFNQIKHPNDVAPPNPKPFTSAPPIKIEDWTLGFLDEIGADFKVNWQYNGQSIGNISIENTYVNDAIGLALEVRATISHDNVVYDNGKKFIHMSPDGVVLPLLRADGRPAGPDMKRLPCASMKVHFDFTWNQTIGPAHKAAIDLQLFGDGTHTRHGRWIQHSLL